MMSLSVLSIMMVAFSTAKSSKSSEIEIKYWDYQVAEN